MLKKSKFRKDDQRIWVVINSWRGVELKAKAFRSERLARKTEEAWRKRANEDYDQVEIIQTVLR